MIKLSVRQYMMVGFAVVCFLVPVIMPFWKYQFLLQMTFLMVGIMFLVLADIYEESPNEAEK